MPLEKAAEQVAFGDDKRKTTTYFKGELAKSLARNRTTTTDQAKAAREYELYLKSQDALGKKLRAKDSATDNVRRLLKSSHHGKQEECRTKSIAGEGSLCSR